VILVSHFNILDRAHSRTARQAKPPPPVCAKMNDNKRHGQAGDVAPASNWRASPRRQVVACEGEWAPALQKQRAEGLFAVGWGLERARARDRAYTYIIPNTAV
jgi:hypothetical protein